MLWEQSVMQVDLDAIEANFDAFRESTGTGICAVVKADAYGMGAVAVAKRLDGKCVFFAVATLSEALRLRDNGIRTPILILSRVSTDAYPQIVANEIRPTVFLYEDALALSQEAQRQGKTALFHIAVDTGMSRIGLQVTPEDAELCARFCALPGITPEGVFSHYADADSPDPSGAHRQEALFTQFLQMLEERGITVPIRHISNSAGALALDSHYEMIRLGISLYGAYPDPQVRKSVALKPTFQWISRINYLKTLPAGRAIGYGGTYVTTKSTRVATVSVGYADGYPRSLSGRFHVLIRGRKAPILGRVCMDQMMVDVTDIPDCAMEDPVVLIGRSGDETITLDQMADAAGLLHYTVVCGISPRVPRTYD